MSLNRHIVIARTSSGNPSLRTPSAPQINQGQLSRAKNKTIDIGFL